MAKISLKVPRYFEELSTILSKIEAILNSNATTRQFSCRPTISFILEPNYEDTNINRLSKWQLL
jgi:hypothetical protein